MTTIYLIRHCQSQPTTSVEDHLWPLSAVGMEQSRKLSGVLAQLGLDHLYCSPYHRCIATLKPFADAHQFEINLDADFRERRLAPSIVRDFTEVWRRSWEDFSYALEGCEDSWVCQNRMIAGMNRLAERHPDATIGVGSHGAAIALFMNHVWPPFGIVEASAVRTPEMFKVLHRHGQWHWERTFPAQRLLDGFATDFRATPGVKA